MSVRKDEGKREMKIEEAKEILTRYANENTRLTIKHSNNGEADSKETGSQKPNQ